MLPFFEITYFSVGPLKIYTWGLFVGLAFTAGYFWVLRQARKKGLDLNKIIGLVSAIFFGAVIGSRVFFLLQEPKRWLADASLLWRIDQGGLMIWGGIIGAILAGWLYLRWVKLDFWEIADLVTPALALGIAIGRIGCFLVNDHQGAATNLPWGILWPDGIVRHPVALYESSLGFLLFGFLLFLQEKIWSPGFSQRQSPPEGGTPKLKTGSIFLLFLISYSIIRFFLDFTRVATGPLADPRWWGLTTSQWISLAIFLVCIFIIYVKNLFWQKKVAEK